MRVRYSLEIAFSAGLLLLLGACSGGAGPSRIADKPVSDYPVKIGNPYTVRGATYVPVDDADYDAVGYASWYGRDHEGQPTARGEAFRRNAISGAHRTLPLPSYVEVTSLDTGRTILVRVNDRGPFLPERIIDLSEGAARLLGIHTAGVAPVRVKRVKPNERERAVLRAGRAAAARPTLPEQKLRSLRARLNGSNNDGPVAPIRSATGFAVQVASFSNRDYAALLAEKLGGSMRRAPSGIYQVLLGPYPDERGAREGLEEARRAGYSDARLVNR